MRKITRCQKGQSEVRKFQDKVDCDKFSIANRFNRYSIENIRSICDSIPQVQYVQQRENRQVTSWESFELVDNEAVIKMLRRTRTMSGLNNVNVTVLRLFMESHPDLLVNVLNKCLQNAISPTVWKYIIVTPIPKVKNSIRAEDMRPINQVHALDKLLQTCQRTTR